MAARGYKQIDRSDTYNNRHSLELTNFDEQFVAPRVTSGRMSGSAGHSAEESTLALVK
jgi:hypothetical protein